MKKVYLLMSALTVCGMSFGQIATPKSGLSPFAEAAPAAKVERPEVHHGSSSSFDRGSVIWSEDFANGLASTNGTWTVGGTDGNIWKHTFTPSNGCFSTNIVAPTFTTAGNGYMIFDCDSANCQDPGPPTYVSTVREGELISPTIDLTGEMAVDVVFEHRLRYCCSSAALELMVGVSNDGGSTWTEYAVDGGLAVNVSSANPVVSQVNISAVAANESNVKIRFRWGGVSHYYWVIDDINIVPSPPHEVALVNAGWLSTTTAGVSGVPYTMVPDEQSQDFLFYGEVSNQGASTETVTFKSEVFNGASSVFTSDGDAGATSMAPGSSLEDTSALVWTSGTSIGNIYDIDLNFDYLDIGSDAISTNNSVAGALMVTDNLYARDKNTYSGSGLWNGETSGSSNAFVMGPVYRMHSTQTIWFVDCALTGSTDAGAFIYAQIYQIDQATGSFDLVYDGSGSLNGEFEVQNYHISSSPTITNVKVPVENGYSMVAGEEYIVCIGHYGGPNALVLMNGQAHTTPEQTVFVLDGTDNIWYYMTSTPLIRANFSDEGLGVNENVANAELGQNVPNPFNGISQITYSLDNSSDVTFEITDVTGKVVKRVYEGVKVAGEYTIMLDANEFSQGIYYYTLTAGEFSVTKKMIVNK